MFGDAVAHARKPSQKESLHLPTIHFSGRTVSFREGEWKESHTGDTPIFYWTLVVWRSIPLRLFEPLKVVSAEKRHRINIAAALLWPVGWLDFICLKMVLASIYRAYHLKGDQRSHRWSHPPECFLRPGADVNMWADEKMWAAGILGDGWEVLGRAAFKTQMLRVNLGVKVDDILLALGVHCGAALEELTGMLERFPSVIRYPKKPTHPPLLMWKHLDRCQVGIC